MTTLERDISASELARRLGCSKRTILARLHAGLIPTAYQSDGGRWYIQPRGALQYTEERAR